MFPGKGAGAGLFPLPGPALPAHLPIGAWLAFQFVAVLVSDQPVAWWAHIGGFIAGALLVIPLRDKRIPLFDKGVAH